MAILRVMRSVLILAITGLVLCCCDSRARVAKTKVEDLFHYMKDHEVDSTVLDQPFFYPGIKDRSVEVYVYTLKQMKTLAAGSSSHRINRVPDDLINSQAEDEYIFNVVFEAEKRDSVFFRVGDDGIYSFLVLRDGKRIKSWM